MCIVYSNSHFNVPPAMIKIITEKIKGVNLTSFFHVKLINLLILEMKGKHDR